MNDTPKLSISFKALDDLQALKAQWTELQEQSDCSFFVSWSWIGHWLSILPTEFEVLSLNAKIDERTVALGLFVSGNKNKQLIPITKLHLHETGLVEFDTLTIEYNDFLIHKQYKSQIYKQLVDELLSHCDILTVSGINDDAFTNYYKSNPRVKKIEISRSSPVYLYDANIAEANNLDFPSSLGAKTRKRIKRSIRLLEQDLGVISLDVAKNSEQAWQYFTELELLHNKRWNIEGRSGAFSNSKILEFHRSLIQSLGQTNQVKLVKITAGSTMVGVLYFFYLNNHAYFYQCGFNYDLDKYSPGYISHYLCIQDFVATGTKKYDFLAGDSQYKKSFGEESARLVWAKLYTSNNAYFLEKIQMYGERIRRKIFRTLNKS